MSDFLPGYVAPLNSISGLGAVSAKTTNYGFNLINFDWPTWHQYEHENWVQVDALIKFTLQYLNLRGVWQPDTDYTAAESVIDPNNLVDVYRATTTHTSGTDFTVDEPLYWELLDAPTPSVTSIFGRVGEVLAQVSDYSDYFPLHERHTDTYASLTAIEAANVHPDVDAIYALGRDGIFTSPPLHFQRVVGEPVHGGKVQSNDGAWWELSCTETFVTQWGADHTVDDNADAINAGIAYAVATNTILKIDAHAYKTESQINAMTGLYMEGVHPVDSKIIKNYAADGGERAMIAVADFAVRQHKVTLRNFTVGAVAHTIAAASTGKLIWAVGDGWVIENIIVDTWQGWAITLNGENSFVSHIEFINPAMVGGTDGVHVAGGSATVQCVYGETYDDVVGIYPIVNTAPNTGNEDINGVCVNSIFANSLGGRVVAGGIAQATSTAAVRDVLASVLVGSGGFAGGGALEISNLSTAGGVVDNFIMESARVDGAACLCSLRIDGPGLIRSSGYRHTIGIDGITYGAQLNGYLVDCFMDDVDIYAGTASSHGIIVQPQTQNTVGLRIDARLQCGAAGGIFLSNNGIFVSQSEFKLKIRELATGQNAVYAGYVVSCEFKIFVAIEGGATSTRAIFETVDAANNKFRDGDFSAVTTPVTTSSVSSRFVDNKGFVTVNGGTATILDGTSSIVVNHGLGYTPSLSEIQLTAGTNFGSRSFWPSSATSTQFTIFVSVAASGSDLPVYWEVRRRPS